jgi:hypothetical protein
MYVELVISLLAGQQQYQAIRLWLVVVVVSHSITQAVVEQQQPLWEEVHWKDHIKLC